MAHMNRCFFWIPVLTLCLDSGDAFAWGGEHEQMTQAAIEVLPQVDRDDIELEKAALVDLYCTFPDKNWPCYGEWGGGVGDPKLPRFPDTRREWEISFYCGWDPVLRKGKGYPHGPPHSWEAAAALFQKAVAALQEGRHEDGIRFLGAMLHYVQDSGSFPHVQPVHRNFHVRHDKTIRADGYAPQFLGPNASQSQSGLGFSLSRVTNAWTKVQTTLPQAYPDAVANRVRELLRWTEQRAALLWSDTGVTFEEAKQLAAKDTTTPRVVEAVKKMRAEKAPEFDAAALDCANECVRVCADVIHTALTLGRERKLPTPLAGAVRSLVFNPSFEDDDGDGVPDGWHVAWLDLNDPAGRAERYRAGTHWEKYVRTGQFSVLILRAPAKGLE